VPIVTRTFRVFVSSTFEDLKEERNTLQKDVFPALRRLCEQHGARFQAVDLRWGVRDEAAFDQKTVEICLREIERCQKTGVKPNFIVLLGQRYGWRSLPTRIEAGEYERVSSRIIDPGDQRLVEDWYERDDNAVPAEFVLKPRTGEWVDAVRWQQLETQLHEILLAAGRAAGLDEAALAKYWASATHQEVLKGLGTTEEECRHVFAFCRDIPDKACDPDLADLRRSLKGQLPTGNFFHYEPGDLDGLCERVTGELSAIIEREARGFKSKPALELEREAHDKFAHEWSLVFGREGVLVEVARYLDGGINRPLVLHGASGCGKSAIMARASEDACLTNPHGIIVRRFIGASPESSNGLTLLRSLSEQIGAAYGAAAEIPVEFDAVARLFAERLTLATAERPLMVFLDALDQLGRDDPARSLSWLGNALPEHCRVVVSTTERLSAIHECELCAIEALQVAHADEALEYWFSKANRTLTREQRQHLLAAFNRCGMPLYLKLAFEEARNWPSWSPLVECKIGQGIDGVIDTFLDRLGLDTNHGNLLVSRSLGYLTAARYGLTEDEMLDVLSADQEVWSDFVGRAHHTPLEQGLPVIVWSRLSLDLEPYLVERIAPGGTAVNFYHRQLAERVAARFLADDSGQLRHKSLTEYFARQAYWLDGETRQRPNARKAAELPWQQRAGGLWQEAEQTLLDCPFLFAKVESGLVLDLDADYRAFLKDAILELRKNHNAVDLIGGALQLSMHVISQDLKQFASQMTGRLLPYKEDHAISHFLADVAQGAPRPWLRPLYIALEQPGGPLVRILEGHLDAVQAVAMSSDGRQAVSASRGRTLSLWDVESGRLLRAGTINYDSITSVTLSSDGQRAVYASTDNTIKVWEVETGILLRELKDLDGSVLDVALSIDGCRAVSASSDNMKVWDVESGCLLHTLKGHSSRVSGVALSGDGRRAVSSSWDNTLKVWDVESGLLLRTLTGHSKIVDGVALSSDGQRAVSASWDNTLKVWDVESGHLLHTLEGHSEIVRNVALSSDGRRAVSASYDKTLKVWDVDSGLLINTLEGHTDWIEDVALSADGRRAISASKDKTLKVWNVDCVSPSSRQESLSGLLWDAVLSSDGRIAIYASDGNALKVWDEEDGCVHTLTNYSGRIWGVTMNVSGLRAVSTLTDSLASFLGVDCGGLQHILENHSERDDGITLSANDSHTVSASWDNSLKVWDVKNGGLIYTLEGHTRSVRDVALSADGRRAVSASNDETLRVWDLENGCLLHILEGHSGVVNCVSISADGRKAVSSSWDHTLKVWDLASGHLLHTLEDQSDMVNEVALSADGRLAVSASTDEILKIWDLDNGCLLRTMEVSRLFNSGLNYEDSDSGRLLRTLEGHFDMVRGVALDTEGRRAVSVAGDPRLKVWDVERGEEVATFTCDAQVMNASFVTQNLVISGDALGRVHWLELVE
jgi:WD40 repeat protein